MNINYNSEWKKAKEELEEKLREIGEYPRIVRCNRLLNRFRGVTLEGGLNILYDMENKKITIWGVGKRYSNGYIEYEQLIKKIEIFKEFMDKMEY